MKRMNPKERIQAAINREPVDRIPYGMWYHVPHVDQDPIHLAEESYRLAKMFDLDFIKLCPFGNYGAVDFGLSCTYYCTTTDPVFERRFAIDDPKEWTELVARSGDYASHGKQLQAAEALKKIIGDEPLPFVQTIFSPLTTAKKVAGPKIFEHLREHPEYVHQALEAITLTTIDFCKKNIEAGVDGFFFASQCSTYDDMTEEEYQEFGVKYDLRVLEACQDAWFNIVHIHGDNTMWKLMADYPVQVVNWHDRWVSPDLKEARGMSDKCFMGGINEKELLTMNNEEIYDHLKAAVDNHGGREGLILSPGCVADIKTPAEKIMAARLALERL